MLKKMVRNSQFNIPKSVAFILGFLVLSGCGFDVGLSKNDSEKTDVKSASGVESANLETNLGGKIKKFEQRLLTKKSVPNNAADLVLGLNEFTNRDFVKANSHFQHALKFDPQNSAIHKLNSLSHHMRGDQGDPEQYKLAGAGYAIAKRYDPGDSSIDYLQGVLSYSQSNFRRAQDHFAQAISINGTESKYYLGLAAASYYLGELDRAYLNVRKAKDIQPLDFYNVQASGMIHAAMGSFDKANLETNDALLKAGGSKRDQSNLSKRIKDWENFYQTNKIKSDRDFKIIMAQQSTDLFGTPTEELLDDMEDVTSSQLTQDDEFGDEDEDGVEPITQNLDMALIDVAIIESEEAVRTSKGVNLLNGLGILYTLEAGRSIGGETLKLGLEGSGLAYALNIFTDAFDRNKMLARPSLLVQHGKSSSFYSGQTMHVVLEGSSQGSIEEIDQGIRLDVVAEFVDADTLTLAVMAERSGLETSLAAATSKAGAPHFAQTQKTRVLGNLTLRFGETMILSGLNQQEKSDVDSKVPVLGEVPLLQYIFRNNVKFKSQKSILILLTPRRASATDQQGEVLGEKSLFTPNNLRDLERASPWLKPASNLRAIVQHLGRYKYFNQMRKGDILLEQWASESSFDAIVDRTLEFLYIQYGV